MKTPLPSFSKIKLSRELAYEVANQGSGPCGIHLQVIADKCWVPKVRTTFLYPAPSVGERWLEKHYPESYLDAKLTGEPMQLI